MIIKAYGKKVSIWCNAGEEIPPAELLNGQPIGWTLHETSGKSFAILAAVRIGHMVFKTDDKTGELLVFSARKATVKATAPTKTAKIIKPAKKAAKVVAPAQALVADSDTEVDW